MEKIKLHSTLAKGIAMAKIFVLNNTSLKSDTYEVDDLTAEFFKFQKAVEKSTAQIKILAINSDIFFPHLEIIKDPLFLEKIERKILKENKNSEIALEETASEICELFELIEDFHIRQRIIDVKDVYKRLLLNLKGGYVDIVSHVDEEVIIVANDLTVSDTANMNLSFVRGFVTVEGGSTSHVAILAKQLGLPYLIADKDIFNKVKNNDIGIIDCFNDELIVNPNEEQISEYLSSQAYQKEHSEKIDFSKVQTKDGRDIQVLCNVTDVTGIEKAIKTGADGIGLFRTEFLYMRGEEFPSLEKQFSIYKDAVQKANSVLVARTFDLGGDKFPAYMNENFGKNPFLGWRAIRISLELTDIFKTQLKALLMASHFGDLCIMFPMIISLEELFQAKELLEECKNELREQKIPFDENIKTGVMIETPSAVFIATQLAKEADFFSLGTNDLTQYILAVDRDNPKTSSMYSSYHPAVLRAIAYTVKVCHEYGKKISLCGEFASDEKSTKLLVGLGIDSLSVNPPVHISLKNSIKKISYKKAKQFAENICKKNTTKEVLEEINA